MERGEGNFLASRDEFVGKSNETGNSKLCFHPNDSHRFEFFLFTVVLVHKYLQSRKCRNLGRSRDLRHGKCAISENENQHAAYTFVAISLPLGFIVMSSSRCTQTCFQVPSLFHQEKREYPGPLNLTLSFLFACLSHIGNLCSAIFWGFGSGYLNIVPFCL